MKRLLLVTGVFLSFTMVAGCMYAIRYDGTYIGKVVDQDTREPIEGAVVLGTWSVLHPNVAGGYHTYYDAREAVTDKHGEFTIPGQGLRVMSNLEPMRVLIYKSGYNYEQESWDSLRTGMYSKDRIKWDGEKPIFPLKKLSMEERNSMGIPSRPDVASTKMKRLTEEINKERLERGLDKL